MPQQSPFSKALMIAQPTALCKVRLVADSAQRVTIDNGLDYLASAALPPRVSARMFLTAVKQRAA